ncbi:MAG: hypothetical protein ACREQP_07780 [Candidatus Binatia bacterium]
MKYGIQTSSEGTIRALAIGVKEKSMVEVSWSWQPLATAKARQGAAWSSKA